MSTRTEGQRAHPAGTAPIVTARQVFDRMFDATWYLAANPDVRGYKPGPKDHYLRYGYAERRNPHPLFDVAWYLAQRPELAKARIEPMSCYFDGDWRRLCSPHPLFDPAWYLLEHPELLKKGVEPIQHYLQQGWKDGHTLHPLFDVSWYLAAYPEIARSGTEPLSHFLTFGWTAGHLPHPLFDMADYRTRYPDLDVAGLNPWLHYITAGWREGRRPHRLFDADWYQRTYLDAVAPVREPLSHYLSEGWREGLRPAPDGAALNPAPDGAVPKPAPDAPAADAAPLYTQVRESLLRERRLSVSGRRGVIGMVVHETGVGGAPHVLRQFTQWLRDRTRFDVRIVAMKGGNLRAGFAEVAPLLVLGDLPAADRTDALRRFLGEDVRGLFINSVASGGVLDHADPDLPAVAFIHELPQVLEMFPAQFDLIRKRAARVIAGGPGVMRVLQADDGFDADRLAEAVSFIEALPERTDFAARRAAARRDLGLATDALVVMGCGVVHWRKSPEVFIAAAQQVLSRGIDAHFVWLGGGPDLADCEARIAAAGLQDRIRFTGYEPDVPGKIAAGDVFMLSSQEDPFPLVALYAAQAGQPIVCFREAGGIEGFVAEGSGIAVPHMDATAMADAVALYAADPARRQADGAVGQAQVARRHTMDVVGPLLLHHLREAMGLAPEVSVVVPNYNYVDYLPERLSSIAAQTFQDFEVILLDDASPDASVPLLEAFAAARPGTRLVVNAQNSGSPFRQWLRGMDLARADLIWMAEADDRCTPHLLETLLPRFDDRNVRLAYCASRPITSDGRVIGDYRALYLDRINAGRWDHDYTATDHEEANAGLGIANSLPNASAVMFRNFRPEDAFVSELTQMRLCGDWYFYVRAMRGGLVGFAAAVMNDHRRHDKTVTHALEGSMRYFDELATVRRYLGRTFRQDAVARDRIAAFLADDIARFRVPDPAALPVVPPGEKAIPSLLMVAPDLSPGGGQVFAISVANEWARRGGRVVLLDVAHQPPHPAMLAKIAPEVVLLRADAEGADLGTLIRRFDLDLVHSGIWWADRWVDMQRDHLPADMPWVISMHGCHETFIANPKIDRTFDTRMRRMIDRATWVHTADKNLQIFDTYGRPPGLTKIANGIAVSPATLDLTRESLGLRPEAMVLCLASRAIASKGWREAVRLTARLNAEGHAVDLMLIGEGPLADETRAEAPTHVHLTGQVTHLQDYLRLADVGLLPSYFVGESMPLILLEMMAVGLPLVATRTGEIPDMIGTGEAAAGLLVPLKGEGLDEEALHAAVMSLITRPETRAAMAAASRARFAADFTIAKMVDRYAGPYARIPDAAGRASREVA
ncbi:glycosyltransferase [Loktanella sp. M215]|uniref:glycosyltransferase n=1 Tax=Loktanella sp. M215 TaxID=2675431 RepID=UPI001F322188|nr:glycosyltransferase [Loktanella sp. M215]MCF7702153.1 glycosyltransferase [Loktanella sp. M215]